MFHFRNFFSETTSLLFGYNERFTEIEMIHVENETNKITIIAKKVTTYSITFIEEKSLRKRATLFRITLQNLTAQTFGCYSFMILKKFNSIFL